MFTFNVYFMNEILTGTELGKYILSQHKLCEWRKFYFSGFHAWVFGKYHKIKNH